MKAFQEVQTLQDFFSFLRVNMKPCSPSQHYLHDKHSSVPAGAHEIYDNELPVHLHYYNKIHYGSSAGNYTI